MNLVYEKNFCEEVEEFLISTRNFLIKKNGESVGNEYYRKFTKNFNRIYGLALEYADKANIDIVFSIKITLKRLKMICLNSGLSKENGLDLLESSQGGNFSKRALYVHEDISAYIDISVNDEILSGLAVEDILTKLFLSYGDKVRQNLINKIDLNKKTCLPTVTLHRLAKKIASLNNSDQTVKPNVLEELIRKYYKSIIVL